MKIRIVFVHVASNHFEFLLLVHFYNLFELDQKAIYSKSLNHVIITYGEKVSGSNL